MGTVISYTSKLLQQEVEIQFKYINYVSIFVTSLEVPLFSSKEGGVPVLLSI